MLTSILQLPLTLPILLQCLAAAAALGILTALVFRAGSRSSASFSLTLSLLPMIVAVIIMLVNGSIGTGIAIAGAFSLVRFRSVAGTGREIAAIFCSMALGLAIGLGYLDVAAIMFLCVAAVTLVLTLCHFGQPRAAHKQLRITIPENMDYNKLFDDVFAGHGVKAQLVRIKSTAMGTMFDLTYQITLPSATVPKAFLDDLRTRNGNLSIVVSTETELESL